MYRTTILQRLWYMRSCRNCTIGSRTCKSSAPSAIKSSKGSPTKWTYQCHIWTQFIYIYTHIYICKHMHIYIYIGLYMLSIIRVLEPTQTDGQDLLLGCLRAGKLLPHALHQPSAPWKATEVDHRRLDHRPWFWFTSVMPGLCLLALGQDII